MRHLQHDLAIHQNNGIKYQCGTCQKLFPCKGTVQIHLQTHSIFYNHVESKETSIHNQSFPKFDAERYVVWQCQVCKKSFSAEKSLDHHLKTHPEIFTEDMKTKKPSIHHQKLPNKVKEDKSAEIYNETHVAGSNLQNSIKHTPLHFPHKPKEESKFQCKECEQSFSSGSTLKRHMKTHSKLMTCDKCGKQFSMDNFLIHTKSSKCSKRKTVFKCKECKKKFSRVSDLNKHMNTHTKPYSCDECGKHFSQKKYLKRHQTSRKCILECKECEISFLSRSDLTKHKKKHKKYECKECGKAFTTRTALLDHENVHKGIKPYFCETCEKSFTTLSILRTHQKTHGPLLYNCEECGKCFASKNNLERHLNLHKGIKPFKCELCGKCFVEKWSLASHMIYHGDARPFQCEICGKGFKAKSNLTGHNKNVKCKSQS